VSAIDVRFGVVFAGFLSVVHRVQVMSVRDMRVMAGLLVLGGAMMLGRLAVVLGGGFVVLGGFFVMLGQ
jgi:hypothetical protein